MTTVVCFTMNQLGEPDAGKPHVRFDERGVETELRLLRHASTLLNRASIWKVSVGLKVMLINSNRRERVFFWSPAERMVKPWHRYNVRQQGVVRRQWLLPCQARERSCSPKKAAPEGFCPKAPASALRFLPLCATSFKCWG